MSRDPTVPVNLTTTTPVGPVERTLAATQSTDRVERLRYWRRGGSTGIYEQRISNTDYDGRWYSVIDNWHAYAPLQLIDLDGVSAVIDPTWSFSGTEDFTAAGVSLATLEITETTVSNGGAWTLKAQSCAAAAQPRWDAGNKPGTATAVATTKAVTSTTGAPILQVLDVTVMVNEVMAGAAWVPGTPINFWGVPTSGGFISVDLAAAPSSSAARLTMVPIATKLSSSMVNVSSTYILMSNQYA